MILVTAGEMQEMDKQTIETFGLPGIVLMENAARGAVDFFREIFGSSAGTRVGVLAGRGNNGGDGFVMARYLFQQGMDVEVYLLSEKEKVSGDARTNLDLLDQLSVPVEEIVDGDSFKQQIPALKNRDVLIDAILGTGLKSEVRGFFRDVIETVNRLEKPVFAVDIPSGLHSDTGQPCGLCVFADATATFGFAKIGHRVHPGRQYTGKLRIVDIGIPPYIVSSVAPRQSLIDAQTAGSFLKLRPPDTHKGKNGHLLVVGGSTGKTGATAMASISAVRAGAGLVTLAIAKSLNPVLESMAMEVMSCPLPETDDGFIDESAYETIRSLLTDKSCLALGPGLGVTEGLSRMTKQLVEQSSVPVVVDADGLNCLAEAFKEEKGLAKSSAPLILTPHPGEMSRLTGISVKDIQNDRVEVARDFAQKHGVHVVLKGAATVSAHPDGAVDINSTGNPGMASGGMGDVLTGLIAGFVCQGYSSREAIALGVYLHGAAADKLEKSRGPWGYMATEVMDAIPEQIAKIRETVCN